MKYVNKVNAIVPKPKPYTIKRGLIVIGLVFLFILTSYAWSHDQFTTQTTALADGQNLVSVYYDGQNKTVATSAGTVGEALQKMGIEVQKGDIVEPATDKPLSQAVTNINIYRSLTYLITDGQKDTVVSSGYRSPRKVIDQAGIPIYPEDNISSERVDNFIENDAVGQHLVIDRATPVTVILAGKTFEFRTHKKTVGELFVEKGLEVKPTDGVSVPLATQLQPGMKIVVNRLAQRIETHEESIAPDVVTQTDSTKPVGYKQITDPGAPGKKIVSVLITEQNGAVQGQQVLDVKVTLAPKPQIVVVGPAEVKPADMGGGWEKLRFCESGGNYANRNNPAYRGAYQFSYSTWGGYGGYKDPADAPPAVQDAKAMELYKARGASPWPLCGRFLR